jgi:leucyl-tRNA synthetase
MIELTTLVLSPGAPHCADEIWEGLGLEGFTYSQPWPKADPDLTKSDTLTIAVQVNGKLRDTIEMPADATNEQIEEAAKASEKVSAHTQGLTVRKAIVVPGKLVNIVAN